MAETRARLFLTRLAQARVQDRQEEAEQVCLVKKLGGGVVARRDMGVSLGGRWTGTRGVRGKMSGSSFCRSLWGGARIPREERSRGEEEQDKER